MTSQEHATLASALQRREIAAMLQSAKPRRSQAGPVRQFQSDRRHPPGFHKRREATLGRSSRYSLPGQYGRCPSPNREGDAAKVSAIRAVGAEEVAVEQRRPAVLEKKGYTEGFAETAESI